MDEINKDGKVHTISQVHVGSATAQGRLLLGIDFEDLRNTRWAHITPEMARGLIHSLEEHLEDIDPDKKERSAGEVVEEQG